MAREMVESAREFMAPKVRPCGNLEHYDEHRFTKAILLTSLAPMKIATFNMRGGGSRWHWSRVITTFKADIVFAQETRTPSVLAAQGRDTHRLRDAHWEPAGHGKWGSAIWVRQGAFTPRVCSGPTWWAAGGELATDDGAFLVCSVHVAPHKSSYVSSANRFLDQLATISNGRPTILGGDWNLTVSERHQDDARKLSNGERVLQQRVRDEFGLVSVWSAMYPGAPLPQTLRWSNAPKTPYHCDGILVPAAWATRLREVRVVSTRAWRALSDHAPVVAEIDMAKEKPA